MKYFLSLLAITVVVLFIWLAFDRQREEDGNELVFTEFNPTSETGTSPVFSSGQINEWFENFLISANNTNRLVRPILDGARIPIETFSTAQDISVSDDVLPLLAPTEWMLYRCPSPTLQPELAFLLHFQLLPDYDGNLYEDQVQFMRFWEASLIEDVGNVLYPPRYYSQTPELAGDFYDTEVSDFFAGRMAGTQLPSGSASEIIYVILDDDLIIANSKNCLEQMQAEIFDLSA